MWAETVVRSQGTQASPGVAARITVCGQDIEKEEPVSSRQCHRHVKKSRTLTVTPHDHILTSEGCGARPCLGSEAPGCGQAVLSWEGAAWGRQQALGAETCAIGPTPRGVWQGLEASTRVPSDPPEALEMTRESVGP